VATNSVYANYTVGKEPVSLLIGAARRRMKRAVTERVRTHGLTSQQFWVLVHIDEVEGASLSEVATRLRIDVPTTSRAVTALLARKLVRAEGDTSDRRRLRLKLSPLGKEKIAPMRALAAELRGATVAGLSREEEETLRSLLRKIIANLNALVGDENDEGEENRTLK
jgi:DNA-binding MarR family transcriptional regulator